MVAQIKLPSDKPKRPYVRRAKPDEVVEARDGQSALSSRVQYDVDLRLQCLALALEGNSSNLNADYVTERAQAFVEYVKNGITPPVPTLEDRLTQAFMDTTGAVSHFGEDA